MADDLASILAALGTSQQQNAAQNPMLAMGQEIGTAPLTRQYGQKFNNGDYITAALLKGLLGGTMMSMGQQQQQAKQAQTTAALQGLLGQSNPNYAGALSATAGNQGAQGLILAMALDKQSKADALNQAVSLDVLKKKSEDAQKNADDPFNKIPVAQQAMLLNGAANLQEGYSLADKLAALSHGSDTVGTLEDAATKWVGSGNLAFGPAAAPLSELKQWALNMKSTYGANPRLTPQTMQALSDLGTGGVANLADAGDQVRHLADTIKATLGSDMQVYTARNPNPTLQALQDRINAAGVAPGGAPAVPPPATTPGAATPTADDLAAYQEYLQNFSSGAAPQNGN